MIHLKMRRTFQSMILGRKNLRFLAHLAMPKMSLYDNHFSLAMLLVLSASVDSILKDEFYMSSLKCSLTILTNSLDI